MPVLNASKLFLVLFCIVPIAAARAQSVELQPFTSDGCSDFPNGTPTDTSLWLNCCIRHDLAYWKGGTYQERVDADLALERCVTAAGEPEIAKLMLQGVRVGGSPVLPTSYRWGYGWPYGRGYKPLTAEEKHQVARQLENLESVLRATREALTAPNSANVTPPPNATPRDN